MTEGTDAGTGGSPSGPTGAPSRLALTLVVTPLIVMVAAGYVVVNFVVDLVYAWIDPRVAYQ